MKAADRLRLVDVTFVCDTSAMAANDLISDVVVCSGVVLDVDHPGILESVQLIDEDNNTAVGLTIFFLSTNGSMGTVNSAPQPTDAVARTILGSVDLATSDFKSLTNSKIATKANIGLILKPVSGTRDVYAAIALTGAGTPTYSASGLKMRLGVRS